MRDDIDADVVIGVNQLIARYCHILDERAWDRLLEVFVEEIVVDAGPELGVHEGLPAVIAFWQRHPHPEAHHAVNTLVTEEPDGIIRAHSKGFFARADKLTGGDYHDEIVRTDDGLRFSRRAYSPRWGYPDPATA